MEIPQSLPWDSTVREWAELFQGDMAHFRQEVSEFREIWKSVVEESALAQKQSAERSIASHNRTLAQQKAAVLRRQKEDRWLRELFRQKNDL